MRTSLNVLLAAALAAACSNSSGEINAAATGTPCKTDGECGSLRRCGFKIVDGCQAAGVCLDSEPTGTRCTAYTPACSCDGTPTTSSCTGLTAGYATRAIASVGACPDAGAEAGADAH